MHKLFILTAIFGLALTTSAADTVVKVSETSVEVTKQAVAPAPVKVKYERAFIEEQIINITKQRDEMIAAKQKELDECKAILAEMDKLGIKVKNETK